MTHSSDMKQNTVHNRAKRSCQNCKRYFVPKNDLPRYVEGGATQVWCNKTCYMALYPQVVDEIKEAKCAYCAAMFVPRNKRVVTCGTAKCKKERQKEYQEKRRENPEYRERLKEYQKQYHKEKMEDPEFREEVKRRRREKYRKDPEFRKKRVKYQREYQRGKLRDPEYREKMNKYLREYRRKNKE